MTHFKTCDCEKPSPNASGRICKLCGGYIPPQDFSVKGYFIPKGQTKPREIYCEKCEAYHIVGHSMCTDDDCPVLKFLSKENE